MVCKIHGKPHFYISQAQSIICAVMQLMTAVGHRHVCPTLTNTCLVNPPIERDFGYPVGLVTKKVVFLPRNQPFEEDFSYHLGWLSVTVCALVPNKAPFSDPPMSCRTPFWPPNCPWLVAVLPQGNVELNFDLFFTPYFNGGWWGGGGGQIGGMRW